MNLQKKRIEKGLSQSELARLSGISLRTLQSYEGGLRLIESAHLKTLLALSSALECGIADIIDDESIRSIIRTNGLAASSASFDVKYPGAKSSLQGKRRAAKVKQNELADLSGCSLSAIKKWEEGTKDINNAKFETLVKLSAALGCTVGDIIEDEVLKSTLRVSSQQRL